MTDPTRRAAPRPATARTPRIVGVLCAVLLAGAGLLASAGGAGASPRHTVHRTVVRKVQAAVTRSATVTAHATVRGRTAAVTTTAKAVGRAAAKATGSATATAASTATARTRALRQAAARAEARARKAANLRASARAIVIATRTARAQATTQAEQAAEFLAARDAGGSDQGTSATGGTDPGSADPGSTDPGGSGDQGTGSQGTGSQGTGGTDPGSGSGSGASDPGSGGGATGTSSCGGESVLKADGSAWTCTFDDEFDGAGLDTSKWLVQLTANSGFNQAGACYTNDPDTISVSGGTLNLTVNKLATPISCPSPKGAFSTNYTAGEVTTLGTFSQTYGRYEVRAQLPASTVAGLQETFWLWPNTQTIYGPWPASGEIDFAEFYSQYAGWVIPYLHYNYDSSTVSWATNTNVVTALPAPYNQPGMNCRIDQAGYNTYVFTWQPGQLTIAVNGQNCIVDNYRATNLASPAPFDKPFFLALTQALGVGSNAPTAATPLPATTHVDYVRVWS